MQKNYSSYSNELGKISLLTINEERELIKKAFNGDKAAQDKLTVSNLRFVFNVAKKYAGKGVPFEDLLQAGNIGLVKAAKSVSPKFKNRFITYAVWQINYEIKQEINEIGKSVKLPADNDKEKFNPKWNFDSLDREIKKSDDGDSITLGCFLQDTSLVNPEDIFIRKEQVAMLNDAINHLPEIERNVMLEHSGLKGESKSYAKIAEEIEYTKQGTNEIDKRAFKKVRKYLVDKYDFDLCDIAA